MKQTLGGHKQNLVHTRTQVKGAVTPQEIQPDLLVSVQESLAGVWVQGPDEGSGALNTQSWEQQTWEAWHET